MISLTLSNKKYLLVENFYDNYNEYEKTYEILSLLKDLTEEQAAEIVPRYLMMYHNYENFNDDDLNKCLFYTALESFHSFLRSHGVEETKNYLILKEI